MKKVTAISRGIGYNNICISFIILLLTSYIHLYLTTLTIVPSITVFLVVVATLMFGYAIGTHRQKGKQVRISDLIRGEVYQVISLTKREKLGVDRTGFIVELALLSARSQGGMRDHETLLLTLIGEEMSFHPRDEFIMVSSDREVPRLVSIYSKPPECEQEDYA